MTPKNRLTLPPPTRRLERYAMDAAKYARIREIFLAIEDLSAQEQEAYLDEHADGDDELIREIRSLLDEHDPQSAKKEGEQAQRVAPGFDRASRSSLTSRSKKSFSQSSPNQTTRQGSASAASITLHGSQRTHASPRDMDSTKRSRSGSRPNFWDQQTRRTRRSNSGWIFLAAVLPTALIGWLTYRQVAARLKDEVRQELAAVANSTSLFMNGFLKDRTHLVESWSRQPAVRQAIMELVEIGKQDDPTEQLKAAPHADLIKEQLQELSGYDDVKFVVWNQAGTILATWLPDRADFGTQVTPDGAANLVRVFAGQRVFFGPERLTQEKDGFKPETLDPVLANIVPIFDDKGKVIAAFLVRGIGTFAEFDRLFREASEGGNLDAYAVDRNGVMVTNSPQAMRLSKIMSLELRENEIAAVLRVSDPGFPTAPGNIGTYNRMTQPLTIAAAGATTRQENLQIEPYNNYAGIPVVGAWRWDDDWQFGVVIERDNQSALAAARIVRYGFLILGSLLTLTAYVAATQIAKQSAKTRAVLHPLGRYELTGELGSGGMGVVYRARHRQLGRDVALKVLRSDRRNREDQLRFDREAKLAASLSNPHSVMIYDYGHGEGGEAFCVMEFLQGITLAEVVARSGPQPYGRVLSILRQICSSLSEAHNAGLLHRDVKPQNVMLSLDPSVGDWAVVFDFGLAKSFKPDSGGYQTAETVWAGTPMYMAPERYRDPAGVDPRSDIYSVGCIAYFLISGRPPYIECDPESLFALVLSEQPISMSLHREEEVPQELVDLVNQCMAKNVDDRFGSADALSLRIDELREKYSWSDDEAAAWWKIHGDDA